MKLSINIACLCGYVRYGHTCRHQNQYISIDKPKTGLIYIKENESETKQNNISLNIAATYYSYLLVLIATIWHGMGFNLSTVYTIL